MREGGERGDGEGREREIGKDRMMRGMHGEDRL